MPETDWKPCDSHLWKRLALGSLPYDNRCWVCSYCKVMVLCDD